MQNIMCDSSYWKKLSPNVFSKWFKGVFKITINTEDNASHAFQSPFLVNLQVI